jgi:hypothetical protein
VVQNLKPYDAVTTVEGATQTIAQGPAASQEIIKQFGTNGGGFFNANSAHPFENPTPLTNFLAMFGDLRDLVGAHLHARQDDRLAEARLGGVGRDGVSLPRRRHHGLLGRGARQPDADGGGRRPVGLGHSPGGNMEGKGSASASPTRRSSPP